MAQDQLEYIYCTREQRKTQTWSLYYSPKALGTIFQFLVKILVENFRQLLVVKNHVREKMVGPTKVEKYIGHFRLSSWNFQRRPILTIFGNPFFQIDRFCKIIGFTKETVQNGRSLLIWAYFVWRNWAVNFR